MVYLVRCVVGTLKFQMIIHCITCFLNFRKVQTVFNFCCCDEYHDTRVMNKAI